MAIVGGVGLVMLRLYPTHEVAVTNFIVVAVAVFLLGDFLGAAALVVRRSGRAPSDDPPSDRAIRDGEDR